MNAIKLTLVALAGWMNRQQQHVIDFLQEEVRILKEQQGIRRPRFTDEQRACLARRAKRIEFGRLKGDRQPGDATDAPEVAPEAHREEVRFERVRRRTGRPPTKDELRDLVIKMAEENRGWGYTRIRGALANIGHEIGRGPSPIS